MTLPQRLDQVAAIAVRLQAETGLPPEELIAQWAIESGWGMKPTGKNNYFGIKRAARHAHYCEVWTREVIHGTAIMVKAEFADYDSLEESCEDFAWLITHGDPYAAAWGRYQSDKNLGELLAGVAKVYATDPSYAHLVTQIAGQLNVCEAIANARKLNGLQA